MRVFLSYNNLIRAAALATVVTLMSLGRLVQGQMPLLLFIPATFGLMMFVGGAVTAWGQSAGMPGVVTDRGTLRRGTAVALTLSLIVLPLRLLWLEALVRRALLSASSPSVHALAYPDSLRGIAALILWSCGFQVLFTQAAPMSLGARLTRSQPVAIAICVTIQAYIFHQQLLTSGIHDFGLLLVLSTLGRTLVGCLVFSRYGLLPTMLLAAGTNVHLFFS
ncbi:MAG: hypothetical protein HN919_04925 [Verrucomicrobia bacterium]|jgi:hypothetical protein|nr:hypothetical protein [Verrucomicrobiota bacterium]MBT7065623.1 hypothetical protein [Verrucomicrobiota bacterium]MBT7702236.1 hypothetical protein [Verrucomicrobiota bacterium]